MNDATEYALNRSTALTDTGTSCVIGPTSEISNIRNSILSLANGIESDNYWGFTFPCGQIGDLPGFELLYGGYWMDVTAADLSIDIY